MLSFFFYRTAYYGEYKCYGPGAVGSKRVQWSHNLTIQEAAPFLSMDLISGKSWIRPAPTSFRKPSAAISNNTDVDGN